MVFFIQYILPNYFVLNKKKRVFGLVVYAGHDTKILNNSNYSTVKENYIEKNSQMYFLFSCIVSFVFAFVIKYFFIQK